MKYRFPSQTLSVIFLSLAAPLTAAWPPAPVVDTGQVRCYDSLEPFHAPKLGRNYFGQDAQYQGVQPNYTDNQNGTITDNRTGLMWSQACDAQKVTLAQATEMASSMTLGGHDDWRVPTIKELYSLIDFRGVTGIAGRDMTQVPSTAIPYINTDYFGFRYGDVANGERYIDAQWLTQTINVSPIMNGQEGLFGVNFADGRIKCYPNGIDRRGTEKTFYARYVRGRSNYGQNDYVDNGNGTVTDKSTGLTWMQVDSQEGMNWEDALKYAEQSTHAGFDDWRLPNAKELQSIVDYTRSPGTTDSPAIDPIFKTSSIKNEAGESDYPYFWTSTTHVDGPNASQAVYVCFGRAIGQMHNRIMDVHGAGAQRSDPKEGDARLGHGPQGDAQRIQNHVRLVRGGAILISTSPTVNSSGDYPHRIQLSDTSYEPEEMTYKERSRGMHGGSDFEHPPQGGHPPKGHHRPPPRR